MSYRKKLESMGACSSGMDWAGERTLEQIWTECERADWLLWLAYKLSIEHKLLGLAACDCARIALKHVPDGEDRPRLAIETAEAYWRGEATIEQVQAAAEDAAEEAAARAARAERKRHARGNDHEGGG